MPEPMTQEWLDLVDEEVVDPGRRIVDPHHHLWPPGGALPYGLEQLHADAIGGGHRVVRTVFVECHAAYDRHDPDHRAPLGETRFVAGEALGDPHRLIGGIVAHTDLRDHDHLDEMLDAHNEAGQGLFRGIRHAGSRAPDGAVLAIPGRAPAGLYLDAAFRRGVARLGERGLTYDTWHYHFQNQDFLALARAVPGTTLVLDHFGTPLGVGEFAGRHDEIFETWKADIAEIARCPNVVAKLGGLAMPDNGFGWNLAQRPPTSAEFVAVQARYYRHAIECFGPERCMFESNFPVDRMSLSYRVLWNGLKKIAAAYSDAEQDALFSGTAARVYRLDLPV
ncbi:MAG: amidohydrolase family protein [Acidimicrobiaceae bacterium]|nr:amidohydrolase family protein [Ilumatobacter sp.]MCB9379868.1 amidohydrolase family protein [Acidimicrobiaceae bacterium]MCO5328898.1 amidohydrolase family protein [Ilumatobacteraceae bacterium]